MICLLQLLTEKESPTWDEFYRDNEAEKMPWYLENLDEDVKKTIENNDFKNGKFLDLGTGPGTQAMQLSNLGFQAVGSDLSQHAIERAKKLYPEASYVVDDILDSKFHDNEFDFILDRGVFHVFEQDKLPDYLKNINRILKKNGILLSIISPISSIGKIEPVLYNAWLKAIIAVLLSINFEKSFNSKNPF